MERIKFSQELGWLWYVHGAAGENFGNIVFFLESF